MSDNKLVISDEAVEAAAKAYYGVFFDLFPGWYKKLCMERREWCGASTVVGPSNTTRQVDYGTTSSTTSSTDTSAGIALITWTLTMPNQKSCRGSEMANPYRSQG